MKEKAWIISLDGEEKCIEVEVSWSRKQEEKLRKNKLTTKETNAES